VPNEINHFNNLYFKLYYRNIIKVIRFFLGYKLFKDNLIYIPIKITNDSNNKIVNKTYINI
jgi:hypothetical protein